MQKLRLRKATNRNTRAHIIELGDHDLYVSYETVIGYAGPAGRFRRTNSWGPTTGRHINEMGMRDWEVVEDVGIFTERVAAAVGFDV